MEKLNQLGNQAVTRGSANRVPGLETKMSSVQEVVGGSGSVRRPWFEPKKGSVIPPKRKLVKRMMLDYILNSIASLSAPNSKKKKKKSVFPDSAWH